MLLKLRMGTFSYDIAIGTPDGSRFEELSALVDTGSFYAWLPQSILNRLGVLPTLHREFETADGRILAREMAETRVRIDGEERGTLVIFGDEGTEPLLGAYTLEGFGLAADPVNERLIQVGGLIKRMMYGHVQKR